MEEGQQTKNESQELVGMVPETETAGERSSGIINQNHCNRWIYLQELEIMNLPQVDLVAT